MDTKLIWQEYHQDLKRFVFSKVKDSQLVDDLLQDVFMKVHTKKNQLIDYSKIKPWLFTIARNMIMDHFKKSSKTEELNEVDLISEENDNSVHSIYDCLPGIINHLPIKYKKPVYLADIKGIKQTDIAIKLKLPLPTIKSQIQRGRKLITKGYMKCCDYKLDSKGKLVEEKREKEDCKMCY